MENEKPKKGRPRAFNREWALQQALKLFWKRGYAPATVSELCKVMEIRPPSLYATFGNKESLFLEAAEYYERAYWSEPGRDFIQQPDLRKAVRDYFFRAATIMTSPEFPCGCLVVLSAVNISEDERRIVARLRELRQGTRDMFRQKLEASVANGQLPAEADPGAIADVLNTLLEGLSLQARDGSSEGELRRLADYAVRLLP